MEKSHVGLYQCYFCGEDIGVLLDRRLRKSLPMKAGVIDMEPCDKCKELMKQGIILLSISDKTTAEEMKGPIPNPHRTGGWVVIKQSAVEKLFTGEHLNFALKHRFAFITDEAWAALGLPKPGKEIDNR